MDRRTFFFGTAAAPAVLATTVGAVFAEGYDNPRRSIPREQEVRRRIRRRVFTRVMDGRPYWIVPTQVAVGWELVNAQRVVVVRLLEERAALVADVGGPIQRIDIAREDNTSNSQELDGSVLEADDITTPSRVTGGAS
jgi:hypothetical protein